MPKQQKILLSDEALENSAAFASQIFLGGVVLFGMTAFPILAGLARLVGLDDQTTMVLAGFLLIGYFTFAFWFRYNRRNKNPLSQYYFFGNLINFRLFFLASLSLGYLGGGQWIWLVTIVAYWALCEIAGATENSAIADQDIEKSFRKSFKTADDGQVFYTPDPKSKEFLHGRRRPVISTLVERVAFWGCGVIVFFGGSLFLTSQLLRDNFEPRFLMASGMLFFVGGALRSPTLEQKIAVRALRLRMAA